MEMIGKIRSRLGPLWWNTALMFVASRMGDVVTLYIGMFLVPDLVDQAKLGAVLPATRLATIFALPFLFVLTGGLKYINVYYNQGELGKVKALIRDLSILAAVLSFISVGLLWFARGAIMERLKIEDSTVFVLIGALTVMTFWNPLAFIAAQSLKRFKILIAAKIVGPIARLVAALLLLASFQVAGYLTAQLALVLAVFVLLISSFWHFVRPSVKAVSYRADYKAIVAYTIPVGICLIVELSRQLVEPWVVRQRLSEVESAAFYVVFTFGQIPLWVAPALIPFLFPVVSEKHERGEDTSKIHAQALFITLLIGAGITVAFLFFGHFLLGLRDSWKVYQSYSGWLFILSLSASLTTFIVAHYTHENACRRYRYLYYLAPLTILELVILYGIWAVPGAQGVITNPFAFVMWTMLLARVLITICIFLEARLIPNFIESCKLRLQQ